MTRGMMYSERSGAVSGQRAEHIRVRQLYMPCCEARNGTSRYATTMVPHFQTTKTHSGNKTISSTGHEVRTARSSYTAGQARAPKPAKIVIASRKVEGSLRKWMHREW